jgi:hypothetical protein
MAVRNCSWWAMGCIAFACLSQKVRLASSLESIEVTW